MATLIDLEKDAALAQQKADEVNAAYTEAAEAKTATRAKADEVAVRVLNTNAAAVVAADAYTSALSDQEAANEEAIAAEQKHLELSEKAVKIVAYAEAARKAAEASKAEVAANEYAVLKSVAVSTATADQEAADTRAIAAEEAFTEIYTDALAKKEAAEAALGEAIKAPIEAPI